MFLFFLWIPALRLIGAGKQAPNVIDDDSLKLRLGTDLREIDVSTNQARNSRDLGLVPSKVGMRLVPTLSLRSTCQRRVAHGRDF